MNIHQKNGVVLPLVYTLRGFGIGAVLGGMFSVMLQSEYGWRSVFLAGAIFNRLMLSYFAYLVT